LVIFEKFKCFFGRFLIYFNELSPKPKSRIFWIVSNFFLNLFLFFNKEQSM
jgi:hypothetical protein